MDPVWGVRVGSMFALVTTYQAQVVRLVIVPRVACFRMRSGFDPRGHPPIRFLRLAPHFYTPSSLVQDVGNAVARLWYVQLRVQEIARKRQVRVDKVRHLFQNA